ncbi:MAG: DUF896 domain-containing protein [Clostridia bacterium]|nr:DUF896 domain-containing protein [Clostridia bacterium]
MTFSKFLKILLPLVIFISIFFAGICFGTERFSISQIFHEEQATLRQEYIQKFRQGMENTLSNVYIMDENGNKRKVEKKK